MPGGCLWSALTTDDAASALPGRMGDGNPVTLVLTNQENRTFHVVSERLTKRFFSFFQAVYCVQETSVHFMVLHGCRTLVDPIPSPLQPPDAPAARHHSTPCRSRN